MHFRHDATEPISKSLSDVQTGGGPLAEWRPRLTINHDMEINTTWRLRCQPCRP